MDDLLAPVMVNRQRGLARELTAVAHNVANAATTGFRREGPLFSEYVARTRQGDSVSMADLNGRFVSNSPGAVTVTGRRFDLALEGDGFFTIARPDGPALTRAGSFQVGSDGILMNASGGAVLDIAGAPIFIPPDAGEITISPDGTITGPGGPLAQIAVVRPTAGASVRAAGAAILPSGPVEPADDVRIRQGALEGSNVDPVSEMARMIEITRAYERAQSLIEDHDTRIRNVLETLGPAR